MVEGGFKRARVHNNFKSEHLTLERKVSMFLVTNGQHPNGIRYLVPVKQLYISFDAPTPKSIIEIDRPLFLDAWDRLRISLVYLR